MAPRTSTEQVVAEVYASVLGIGRAGALDDFFAIGGHSLLAMHVWSHLRDRLGVELPLRALFEHPTVEALARVVDAAPRGEAPEPEIRVTARRRTVRTVTVVPVQDEQDSPAAAALGAVAGGDL